MTSLPIDGSRFGDSGVNRSALQGSGKAPTTPMADRSGGYARAAQAQPSDAAAFEPQNEEVRRDENAALRFLQRWQTLASQPADSTTQLENPAQARAMVDRLQWQLAARPAQALQVQGALDPARVAQWLQH